MKFQKSTCDSTHSAIEKATTTRGYGEYSVTGVVEAIDSRHGFVRSNSVVDLQRGET